MSCRIYLFPTDRSLPKYWETHRTCVGHLLAAQLAMTQLEAARRHHLHLAHTSATAPPLHGCMPRKTTTKDDPVKTQHVFIPSEATPFAGQRREASDWTHTPDPIHTHDGSLQPAGARTPWDATVADACPNNAHTMYANRKNAEEIKQHTDDGHQSQRRTKQTAKMLTGDSVPEATPGHEGIEPACRQNAQDPSQIPPQSNETHDKTPKPSDTTTKQLRHLETQKGKHEMENKYLIPWPRPFAARTDPGPELHQLVQFMKANINPHLPVLIHTTRELNYKIAGATTTPISINAVYLAGVPWDELVRVSLSFIYQYHRGNKKPREPTRASMIMTLGNLTTLEGIADEIKKTVDEDRTFQRLIQNEIAIAVVADASVPGAWLLNYIYSAMLDMVSTKPRQKIEVRDIPTETLKTIAKNTLRLVRRNARRLAPQHSVPSWGHSTRTDDVAESDTHAVFTMQVLAWLLLERRSVRPLIGLAWHACQRTLPEMKPAG